MALGWLTSWSLFISPCPHFDIPLSLLRPFLSLSTFTYIALYLPLFLSCGFLTPPSLSLCLSVSSLSLFALSSLCLFLSLSSLSLLSVSFSFSLGLFYARQPHAPIIIKKKFLQAKNNTLVVWKRGVMALYSRITYRCCFYVTYYWFLYHGPADKPYARTHPHTYVRQQWNI